MAFKTMAFYLDFSSVEVGKSKNLINVLILIVANLCACKKDPGDS